MSVYDCFDDRHHQVKASEISWAAPPGPRHAADRRRRPNDLWCTDFRASSSSAMDAIGDDGIWLVSFMHYDLGYFDLEQRTLQPLDNPFGTRLSPMS